MDRKKAIVITDENQSYIPVAVLIVHDDVDIEKLEKEIAETKSDMSGEWKLSDIIERISIGFDELEFECVSV